jgi:hypothetical protein
MTRTSRIFVFAVLLALAMGIVGPILHAQDGSSNTAKELERIKREMRQKKKELNQASRKERSVLADLDKIDRDMEARRAELFDQKKRLKDAETALREIETSSAAISRELASRRSVYGMRLRAPARCVKRQCGGLRYGQSGQRGQAGQVSESDRGRRPGDHQRLRQRSRPTYGAGNRDREETGGDPQSQTGSRSQEGRARNGAAWKSMSSRA